MDTIAKLNVLVKQEQARSRELAAAEAVRSMQLDSEDRKRAQLKLEQKRRWIRLAKECGVLPELEKVARHLGGRVVGMGEGRFQLQFKSDKKKPNFVDRLLGEAGEEIWSDYDYVWVGVSLDGGITIGQSVPPKIYYTFDEFTDALAEHTLHPSHNSPPVHYSYK